MKSIWLNLTEKLGWGLLGLALQLLWCFFACALAWVAWLEVSLSAETVWQQIYFITEWVPIVFFAAWTVISWGLAIWAMVIAFHRQIPDPTRLLIIRLSCWGNLLLGSGSIAALLLSCTRTSYPDPRTQQKHLSE